MTLFFSCVMGSGCLATNFCKVSIFLEPIKPCWESNRTCQPDPGRGVKLQSLEWEKGCRGLGSNPHPPVRELARWTTRPHRRPWSCSDRNKTKRWCGPEVRHSTPAMECARSSPLSPGNLSSSHLLQLYFTRPVFTMLYLLCISTG